ncbi:MAG: hypothetical protein A4E50_01518 [Methanosaeta sp. PtaB.Bin087]|jgi:hypothetical protein|nr:MAG: hypothetical protein A4E50_01518 [Methanosaeta sp. PtaB.Bin087]OPY52583.1 MAG: hypothetical protein A4E51_01286 [Methanosaeta sp. PtaU1.Bin055]HNR57885.1 hypothetical protein [Methanothrix sp.]HPY73209.1 hypothetical protein [Methanothrix sp.]
MIAVMMGIVVLAMMIGIFGVFLYDRAAAIKSGLQSVEDLRGRPKRP